MYTLSNFDIHVLGTLVSKCTKVKIWTSSRMSGQIGTFGMPASVGIRRWQYIHSYVIIQLCILFLAQWKNIFFSTNINALEGVLVYCKRGHVYPVCKTNFFNALGLSTGPDKYYSIVTGQWPHTKKKLRLKPLISLQNHIAINSFWSHELDILLRKEVDFLQFRYMYTENTLAHAELILHTVYTLAGRIFGLFLAIVAKCAHNLFNGQMEESFMQRSIYSLHASSTLNDKLKHLQTKILRSR